MSDVNPWWSIEEEEGDAGQIMVALADDLRSRDTSRRTCIRVWEDIYKNRSLIARDGTDDPFGVIGRSGLDISSVNVSRNIVDFVHSKVTSEIPSVKAESHGGDHSEQRRAIKLSRYIAGTFEAGKASAAIGQAVLGALRVGLGAVKVVIRGGKIGYEPTSARELFVDPDDGRHGDPRCLYQIKPVDKRALAAEHPDYADQIMGAGGSSDPQTYYNDIWTLAPIDQGESVDVYEAWCLPLGDEPGRHILAIQGQTIIDDEDEDVPTAFPICFLNPVDPDIGRGCFLQGQGFIEQLVPLQTEINETIASINKSERMLQTRIFLPDGSDIAPELLEDPAIANIILFRSGPGGGTPQAWNPPAVSEQRIVWLKQLIDWAYSLFGMSEQSASSQRPAGVNSGRAMLVYHDITTLRHVDLAKRVGAFTVELAERTIDIASRLDDDAPGRRARYSNAPGGPRDIDWSQVRMDEDKFVISLEETSPVPDTFAGHVQMIEQDVAEGKLAPEDLLDLRQDPDAEARWDISTADGDFCDWVIEELLDGKAELPPVLPDECNVPLLSARLRAEILRATMARAKPEVIDRLQRYFGELAEQTAPPQPPPGPPGAPGPNQAFQGGIAPTAPGQG